MYVFQSTGLCAIFTSSGSSYAVNRCWVLEVLLYIDQGINVREGFRHCRILHRYNECPLNLGNPKQKSKQKSCRAQEGENQENKKHFKYETHQIQSKISPDCDNIIHSRDSHFLGNQSYAPSEKCESKVSVTQQ